MNRQFQALETDAGKDAISAIIDHVDKVIYKFQLQIAAEEENECTETESTCSSCDYRQTQSDRDSESNVEIE